MLREVFLSGQTSMTKSYLRFLVERIEVQPAPKRSVEVNIVGRSGAAVALIASTANGNQSRGPVLGSVGSWLRVRRTLRTLSVNGFGTDSDVRADPRPRSRCDSENLRRERWDRFADSLCPIVGPSPRERVPSGHVERKRGVPAPAGL